MNLKNAFGIFTTKSGLILKALIYDFIIFIIMAALGAGLILPSFEHIFNEIGALDILGKIWAVVGDILGGNPDLAVSVDTMNAALDDALAIIQNNFWVLRNMYIVAAILIVAFRFVYELRSVSVSDILNSHMDAHIKDGFTSNYIRNIGMSAKYSIFKLLMMLPYYAVLFAGGYFAIGFIFSVFGIFAPMLLLIFIVTLTAIKNTLFFGWLPNIVQGKNGVWRSFANSCVYAKRNFFKIFAKLIFFYMFGIAFTVALTIFTFGIGLFIALPCCFIFLRCLELTHYYNDKKLRYYTDENTIYTPKEDINTSK